MEDIESPFPVASRWILAAFVALVALVGVGYRVLVYDQRHLSERDLAGMTGERTIGSGNSAGYREPKTYRNAMH